MPELLARPRSREWRLVGAILGADWSATTSHRWDHDLFSGIDWTIIPNLAWQHKIRPMMAATLREAGWPQPASAVRASIEAAERRCAGKAVCQLDLLEKLTKAAAQEGLHVIALKGVALSLYLYGDPFIREAFDLDFLVPPADFARFRDILLAHECHAATAKRPLSPRQTAILNGFGHDEHFTHAPSGTVIECHYRLETNPFLLHTDHDALWQRRALVPLAGSNIAVLGRDDLVHYLITHASRHGWERLKWMADLIAIHRTVGEAELLCRRDRARDEDYLMLFDVWLMLARSIAGTDLSPEMQERLSHNRHARDLAHRALRLTTRNLSADNTRGLGMKVRRVAFRLSLKRSLRYMAFELALLWHHKQDWHALRLPDRFIWLYYIYCPFGHMWRRIRRNVA
jgi:hypothetical protein